MAKNTVLGEDAEIYQKRKDMAKEREKLKGLPFWKKIGYIKDYYFKIAIVCGIALAVVVYLIYMLVRPKDEVVLRSITVNDTYTEQNKETLINDFGKIIDYNPKKQVISMEDNLILDANYPDGNVQQKIVTYSFAGTLDIMIADKDIFTIYAKNGFFLDLSKVLSASNMTTIKNDILYETLNPVPEEDLNPGEEPVDSTTEHAYGVCLDNSTIYTSLSNMYSYQKDSNQKKSYYIGIVANSKQKDNAVAFIKYLKELQQ